MRETCYCGRTGGVSDREPVVLADGAAALRCPDEACGHVDRLEWLPEEAKRLLLGEAARKRPAAA